MVIEPDHRVRTNIIMKIEQVEKFKSLGCWIMYNLDEDLEVGMRIEMTRLIFLRMRN